MRFLSTRMPILWGLSSSPAAQKFQLGPAIKNLNLLKMESWPLPIHNLYLETAKDEAFEPRLYFVNFTILTQPCRRNQLNSPMALWATGPCVHLCHSVENLRVRLPCELSPCEMGRGPYNGWVHKRGSLLAVMFTGVQTESWPMLLHNSWLESTKNQGPLLLLQGRMKDLARPPLACWSVYG